MPELVKLMGSEISLTTANTINNAYVVRVFNNTAGPVLITTANTAGTIGTVTLAAGAHEHFQKASTDTIAANAAVRAVAVAFN